MITCCESGIYIVTCQCSNCGGIIQWLQYETPSREDFLRHNFDKDEELCKMCHIFKEMKEKQ